MNNNFEEMTREYTEGEKQAVQFAFLLQKDYAWELSQLKEMVDNGDSPDLLKDRIDSLAENAKANYQKISDIYYDMNFDTGICGHYRTFHPVMIKLIRDRACKLNAAADKMEIEYNGGMTDREIDNMCWKVMEGSSWEAADNLEILNGMTLRETKDNLEKILNNGYTYTFIMNAINELLEFKCDFPDFDPDRHDINDFPEYYHLRYDEKVRHIHEEGLLLNLQRAGVDVDKVREYLSTVFKK